MDKTKLEMGVDRNGKELPGAPLPLNSPIGTRCAVFRDNGSVLHTKTRSVVEKLRGQPHSMVFLDGVSGFYVAARVRVLVEATVLTWDGP